MKILGFTPVEVGFIVLAMVVPVGAAHIMSHSFLGFLTILILGGMAGFGAWQGLICFLVREHDRKNKFK